MVAAEFSRAESGDFCLVMKGHSTYKERGQLIVCAAISSVLYTLLGYINNTFGCNARVVRLAPGDVHIECVCGSEEAFRMACIGFLQIGETYPTEISVSNKVWESRLCRPMTFDIINFNFEG